MLFFKSKMHEEIERRVNNLLDEVETTLEYDSVQSLEKLASIRNIFDEFGYPDSFF